VDVYADGVVTIGSITSAGYDNGSGAGTAGGAITVRSTGDDVTVNGPITSAGGDASGVAGADAGQITLQAGAGTNASSPNGSFGVPDGVLSVDGDITATGGTGTAPGSGGDVSLNGMSRGLNPQALGVASIVLRDSAGDGVRVINTTGADGTGAITMGVPA